MDINEAKNLVQEGHRKVSSLRQKVGHIVVIVIGLTFFAYGSFRTFTKYKFQKEGLHADAIVIDNREDRRESDNDSRITYTPILRFASEAGDSITTEFNLSSNPPQFEIGEHVIVYYLPEDPKHIETGFYQLDTIVFGGMAILGFVFLIVGLIWVRRW